MDITALVFDGVTSREVLAPIESAGGFSPVSVALISPSGGAVNGFEPFHRFAVHGGIDEVRPADLLLIPGGLGSVAMMRNSAVTAWIELSAGRSAYVLSVSTGSLLLAAAGLLAECDASGHWLAHDDLASAGACPTDESVTWQGRIITTAGAVAAADVAATLPERLRFGPAA